MRKQRAEKARHIQHQWNKEILGKRYWRPNNTCCRHSRVQLTSEMEQMEWGLMDYGMEWNITDSMEWSGTQRR